MYFIFAMIYIIDFNCVIYFALFLYRYKMVLTPFTSRDSHGKVVLLDAGLLSRED